MKPIIGIIICGINKNSQFVPEPYIHAIIRSGGTPVLIPCSITKLNAASLNHLSYDFNSYYKFCSGFLFCGGGDISPLLFNQSPLDNNGATDLKTDLFQIGFMEYLLEQKKPVLGICRGMQIMNVALGGTLYQDLSLQGKQNFIHMQNSLSRSDISHLVKFAKDSKLYNLFGVYEYTNSFHHQAICKTGEGITACGYAEDGVIEAIESDKHPFAIGVQWHPECLYDISSGSRKLFKTFIKYGAGIF